MSTSRLQRFHRSRAIAREGSTIENRSQRLLCMSRGESDKLAYVLAQESFFLDSSLFHIYSRHNSFAFSRQTFICINHGNIDIVSGHYAFYEPLSTVSTSVVWPVESNNFIRPYQRPNAFKKARKYERSKKLLTYCQYFARVSRREARLYFCKLHRAIRSIFGTMSIIYKIFFCSVLKNLLDLTTHFFLFQIQMSELQQYFGETNI